MFYLPTGLFNVKSKGVEPFLRTLALRSAPLAIFLFFRHLRVLSVGEVMIVPR